MTTITLLVVSITGLVWLGKLDGADGITALAAIGGFVLAGRHGRD